MIAICFRVYHTLKGDFKNTIIEAFRCHRFANVHLQARKIAIDCFHSFNLLGPRVGPKIPRIKKEPRSFETHFRSLEARFAALRADPSFTEVAPGVFSSAAEFANAGPSGDPILVELDCSR